MYCNINPICKLLKSKASFFTNKHHGQRKNMIISQKRQVAKIIVILVLEDYRLNMLNLYMGMHGYKA